MRIAKGCDGVALFCTTSEAASFGMAQRQEALDGLTALGVQTSSLIVGPKCCSIANTTRRLSPRRGRWIYRFFAGLADTLGEARRDIIAYHLPETIDAPISHNKRYAGKND